MLEATFSPLIPTAESEFFYKNFFNQYSFIQVNDAIIGYTIGILSEEQRADLIDCLNNFDEDQNYAVASFIGTGIMNPALMRRRKENRGISTELFSSLESKNIDSLGWYQRSIEFLMVYAVCEQAIKDYLTSKEIPNNSLKEDNILFKLFDRLQEDGLRKKFILELSEGSSAVLKSQNELIAVWHYYTHIRHTLAHTGGRTTDRAREAMDDSIKKNKKELEDISSAMFIEFVGLDDSDDSNFFENLLVGDIVNLSDKHLNFFRNVAVLIVESIERTLHPNEYKIENFDPYKL